MRRAAGIMMVILGAFLLFGIVMILLEFGIDIHDRVYEIFFMICSAFLITGGVFCLKRKYWELCLASALVVVFPMIWWLRLYLYTSYVPWVTWVAAILGTPPIIFVCLTKKEWKEIQG
jgi:hypothetical protein